MATPTLDISNTIAAYAVVISVAAFLVSLVALVWNIIHHFMLDRVHLSLNVQAGLVDKAVGEFTFLEAGNPANPSLTIPAIAFTLLNDGRRNVFINAIGIEYRVNRSFAERVCIRKEPRKSLEYFTEPCNFWLQPYEGKTHIRTDPQLIDKLKTAKVRYFFAEDAKRKRWRTTRKVHARFCDKLRLI